MYYSKPSNEFTVRGGLIWPKPIRSLQLTSWKCSNTHEVSMQSHLELCKQKIKETKVCANGFGWRSSGAVCKALVASIHRPTTP